MDRIYLDNAATTALSPEVLAAMQYSLEAVWGNASSIHWAGRAARKQVDAARKQVAAALRCAPQEIYFTSGGSESDNWAIKGAAFAGRSRGNHIITTQVEHHAVLHTCQWLEKQGFEVTYLPVDREGRVDPAQARKAVTDRTILMSVMMANNEIGTIQPIRELAEIAHASGILMHTDAVQAMGVLPVIPSELGVDMLSVSAHKFHGPKGVGALYVRKGVNIDPLINGGAQERGRRGGTENTPAIVGMGEAITRAAAAQERNAAHQLALRDKMLTGIMQSVPGARVNGSLRERLPGNLNISFDGIEGEALLLRLDLVGVCASSGSACTSGSLDPSHVLMAIGLTPAQAAGSLRLTVGNENSGEEIERFLQLLPPIVQSLRDMR